MSRKKSILLVALQLFCLHHFCVAQTQVVQWKFDSTHLGGSEFSLNVTAKIAEGWHLYSQFIADEGPLPTRIQFESSDAFLLEGRTEEKGHPVSYYDSIYEMRITWYRDRVSFQQRVRMIRPTAIVRGSIEYMVCNDHACIPEMRGFSFNLSLGKTP